MERILKNPLTEMRKQYVLLSLKHSTKETVCFWMADDCGYTENPWSAGVYTEEQIRANPKHYNDGFETVAVELTHDSLREIGLLFVPDLSKIKAYFKANSKKFMPTEK
jgi:hypothetical protein